MGLFIWTFYSQPSSLQGFAASWMIFIHWCLSSTFIASSVNDNLVHDAILSVHVVLSLPRVWEPDVEPCIISFFLSSSIYVHSTPVSFLWQMKVNFLSSQLSSTHLLNLLAVRVTMIPLQSVMKHWSFFRHLALKSSLHTHWPYKYLRESDLWRNMYNMYTMILPIFMRIPPRPFSNLPQMSSVQLCHLWWVNQGIGTK